MAVTSRRLGSAERLLKRHEWTLFEAGQHLRRSHECFDVFAGQSDIFDLTIALLRRFGRSNRDYAAVFHDHASDGAEPIR